MGKGRSPDIHRNQGSVHSKKVQILSDRQEYNGSTRKQQYGFEHEMHHEAHRDISPYRVENFIEMLQNFGISDAMIKKRIISQSPLGHSKKAYDISSESLHEPSTIIRNVRISCVLIGLEEGSSPDDQII